MLKDAEAVRLVPSDTWAFELPILDMDGRPLDLTGWTIIKRSIAAEGVRFDVDVVFAPGVARVSAAPAVTRALPMGNVSRLTVKVASPAGKHSTVISQRINGVPVRTPS